ncbi:MAG: hypothetical protein JXA41_11690 [Deltaproteobacteria bacterium]|nr:hypothetical protein [Deltaproteobacteria bacterium]
MISDTHIFNAQEKLTIEIMHVFARRLEDKKIKYVHYFMVQLEELQVKPNYSRWPDKDNPLDAPTR